MVAAQQGNAGAYRRLLDELRKWLCRFYARRLPPAMVEDAVQDALIAIHDKRHTYDPERPFKPWLVADFLILNTQSPRSLATCTAGLVNHLGRVAKAYGRETPAQDRARALLAGVEGTTVDAIFDESASGVSTERP